MSALELTRAPDELFLHTELGTDSWQVVFIGQHSYQGVAILSRTPLTDISAGIQGFPDEQKQVLAASVGDVRVIDLYIPNGRAPRSEKFAYKLKWLGALRDYLRAELAHCSKTVLLGDSKPARKSRRTRSKVVGGMGACAAGRGHRT